MKPLDIINSVDFGYRLIWTERKYLARLAIVPVIVQSLTLGLLMALGWEQEYLRIAIVKLPSLFVHGWMFSHLTRLVFYGQRWPFQPTGNAVADSANLHDRAFGISAGTLFYVVMGYLLYGVMAAYLHSLPEETIKIMSSGQTMPEPSPQDMFVTLTLTVFLLLAARFFFLYIPAAAGLSVKTIAFARRGISLSLQMVGIVLVCCIPVLLVAKWLLILILSLLFAGQGASIGLVTFAQIWVDLAVLIMQLIFTASIAYGIKTMMSDSKKP